MHHEDASAGKTPVNMVGPADVSDNEHEDHATLELAPAIESPDIQDPSAHFDRPVGLSPSSDTRDSEETPAVNDLPPDRNVHEPTLRTTGSRTLTDIDGGIHSDAIIDELTPVPDATAPPPARDEEQEPFPPDPDTTRYGSPPSLPDIVVPDSSSRQAQSELEDTGHSTAATSGVVPEPADTLAEPAPDNARTGLYRGTALRPEPSSHSTQNDVDMSPASAPPESVPEGFPDIHPSVTSGGQQAIDPPWAFTSDDRAGLDTGGTRDDEQTVKTAYGELGSGAEWVDDAAREGLQSLDESFASREGVEEGGGVADDTRFD
ncbi:hypothetical protein BDW22DRAFT_699773 [Trametopsis cervina]|nr:hypothetical protein BDW22DRAFT_699773 [Trametopsis cervina]